MDFLREFLASFELFGAQYAAGWLAAAALAIAGVLVVAEHKIFLGAAAAQSSILGCAIALVLADVLHLAEDHFVRGESFATALAIVFALLATVVVSLGRETRVPRDVRSALVFLAASSFAILVVSKSPHGLEEVHRIVASSLLGATGADAALFGVLLTAGITASTRWRRPLLLIAMDPESARACGLRVGLARTLTALYTGIAVGGAIRCAGLLYAFGMLVLPACIAARLAGRSAVLFWLSPLLAVALAVPSFAVAHTWDLPPGQLTVAVLCVAFGVGRRRSAASGRR